MRGRCWSGAVPAILENAVPRFLCQLSFKERPTDLLYACILRTRIPPIFTARRSAGPCASMPGPIREVRRFVKEHEENSVR